MLFYIFRISKINLGKFYKQVNFKLSFLYKSVKSRLNFYILKDFYNKGNLYLFEKFVFLFPLVYEFSIILYLLLKS